MTGRHARTPEPRRDEPRAAWPAAPSAARSERPMALAPAPRARPMVQVVDIDKTYRAGTAEVHALRGVSLQAEEGILLAVKGRSGSGKTTLLNCIGGLDKPDAGTIMVDGHE